MIGPLDPIQIKTTTAYNTPTICNMILRPLPTSSYTICDQHIL